MEPLRLSVDYGDFGRLAGADRVRLMVREGALGVRWLERIDPTP